jgi:hypothetical protein
MSTPEENEDTKAVRHRLESLGWALFLLMIGGMWLVPGNSIPQGTWLIGAGLIMLGVNLAKRRRSIPMNGFTIVIGILAIGFGVAEFADVELPFWPIVAILVALSIIAGPLIERMKNRRDR